MGSKTLETLIGAVVIAVAVIFFFFAYDKADVARVEGITVTADFSTVGSLKPGADVRLAGIKVGTVTRLSLGEAPFYGAIATLNLRQGLDLPDDSSASIASESLLGGNYVQISPGGSSDALQDGGQIEYTQPAVDLMDMISRAMFGGVSQEQN
ncbi:MAG: outer membrane lipid asymmetry maintenance protein MlaD [Proteobacteria bacterium]|nr:outer membrane lipid asymmetry maintenance protein MlaD [Pseudomonadota bacterium]